MTAPLVDLARARCKWWPLIGDPWRNPWDCPACGQSVHSAGHVLTAEPATLTTRHLVIIECPKVERGWKIVTTAHDGDCDR